MGKNTSCHLLSPFLDTKEKTDRKPRTCVRETDRFREHLFGITTILSSDWLTTSRSAIKGQIGEVNQCKTMTVHDGAS